jgi:C4-dicarboxylate transporter DctM subunit
MTAALLLIFAFLLFSGLPIFLTFGITALVMLTFFSPIPVLMVPEVMYNSLGGFTLLAIPFFTLTAQFMLKGGSSRYLISLANCLVGHWWGGLAIV